MTVAFAFTGSFCTFEKAFAALREVKSTFGDVIPVFSQTAASTDTRFGRAEDFLRAAETICGHAPVTTVAGAEPLGPRDLAQVMVIAPCTGNTLAKLAHGINDTAVTMAAKSLLRNGRPIVIGLSTNDGLAVSAGNVGSLLARRNIYFVPFRQDDPAGKPRSLTAELTLLPQTLTEAISGRQLQPLLLSAAG